jgi:hypothetical protein
MPNVSIVSTTNSIKVDFGDYTFSKGHNDHMYDKGTWRKDEIASIRLNTNLVEVLTKNGIKWYVSDDGYDNTLQVDTVDAAAPSSLSDLYDKLIALIA